MGPSIDTMAAITPKQDCVFPCFDCFGRQLPCPRHGYLFAPLVRSFRAGCRRRRLSCLRRSCPTPPTYARSSVRSGATRSAMTAARAPSTACASSEPTALTAASAVLTRTPTTTTPRTALISPPPTITPRTALISPPPTILMTASTAAPATSSVPTSACTAAIRSAMTAATDPSTACATSAPTAPTVASAASPAMMSVCTAAIRSAMTAATDPSTACAISAPTAPTVASAVLTSTPATIIPMTTTAARATLLRTPPIHRRFRQRRPRFAPRRYPFRQRSQSHQPHRGTQTAASSATTSLCTVRRAPTASFAAASHCATPATRSTTRPRMHARRANCARRSASSRRTATTTSS